jgi:hypothetical protein
MGIMNSDDYLNTVYYLDGAKGPDADLWEEGSVENGNYTLNGYIPRIKKINTTVLPINEELIGLNADLVQKKAEQEVEEASYNAAV